MAPDKIDLKIQLGDIDGDGKQDVTVTTKGGQKMTIYAVREAAVRIVEIVAAIIAALGIEGMM